MKFDIKTIKQLEGYGLTEKEAIFYYTAIQIGPFSISGISRISQIKRPTCYLVVDSLIQKGLIIHLASGQKKLYKAVDPEILHAIVEKQYRNTKNLVSKLTKIKNDRHEDNEIILGKGIAGVQKAFTKMITQNTSKHIYYIGNTKRILETTGEVFVDYWINERIKKGIWTHGVRVETKNISKKLYEASEKNLRELISPPKNFNIKNNMYIYDDTFVLTGENNQEPFALTIKNKELVETMMSLYHSMKKISEEYKK